MCIHDDDDDDYDYVIFRISNDNITSLFKHPSKTEFFSWVFNFINHNYGLNKDNDFSSTQNNIKTFLQASNESVSFNSVLGLINKLNENKDENKDETKYFPLTLEILSTADNEYLYLEDKFLLLLIAKNNKYVVMYYYYEWIIFHTTDSFTDAEQSIIQYLNNRDLNVNNNYTNKTCKVKISNNNYIVIANNPDKDLIEIFTIVSLT